MLPRPLARTDTASENLESKERAPSQLGTVNIWGVLFQKPGMYAVYWESSFFFVCFLMFWLLTRLKMIYLEVPFIPNTTVPEMPDSRAITEKKKSLRRI